MEADIENRINQVKSYINNHLSDPLALSDLATIANLSPFYFQRMFKQLEGETPKQYVKRIRLEAAAHAITLYPDGKILNVALEFGFGSLESFSRAFKNHYQISPANFRKLSKEDKFHRVHPESKTASVVSESYDFKHATVDMPNMTFFSFQKIVGSRSDIVQGFIKMKKFAETSGINIHSESIFGWLLDHPNYTDIRKCRFYVCLVHPDEIPIPTNFIKQEISKTKYLSLAVKGEIPEWLQTIEAFVTTKLSETQFTVKHPQGALIYPNYQENTGHFSPDEFNILFPISIR